MTWPTRRSLCAPSHGGTVSPAGAAGTVLWCANVHTNEEYKYLVERMPVYKRTQDRPVAEEEGRKFLREHGAYDKQVQTTLTLGPDTGGAAAGIRPLQGQPLRPARPTTCGPASAWLSRSCRMGAGRCR